MKEIIIKSCLLQDFKGWKQFSTDFKKQEELIAPNGGGKTSILKAFLWMLGYNQEETTPKNNNVELEDANTSVYFDVVVDSAVYKLGRTKTSFFIDDTKVKTKKEYQKAIEELFGVELDYLEMLVSTSLFNADTNKWSWSNRLQLLEKLFNVKAFLKEMVNDENFNLIADDLAKGKSVVDIEKSIRQEKKRILQSKENQNSLLDTKKAELAKYSGIDFQELTNDLIEVRGEIEEEKRKEMLSNKRVETNSIKGKIEKKKLELAKLSNLHEEESKKKEKVYQEQVKAFLELEQRERDLDEKVSQTQELKNSVEPVEEYCPYCRQRLTEEQIRLAEEKQIEEIKEYDVILDNAISELENIKDNEKDVKSKVGKTWNEWKEVLTAQEFEKNTLLEEITSLENELEKQRKPFDDKKLVELREQERLIMQKLAYEQVYVDIQKEIARFKDNIKALVIEESNNAKKMAQFKAYFEKVQELYASVITFDTPDLHWLFFSTTQEGEINTDCVIMRKINGWWRTYYQMSTGERLWTDIAVVKSLQKILGVQLPIWVENAQDVTDEITCDSQIIYLSTSKITNNLEEKGVRFENE